MIVFWALLYLLAGIVTDRVYLERYMNYVLGPRVVPEGEDSRDWDGVFRVFLWPLMTLGLFLVQVFDTLPWVYFHVVRPSVSVAVSGTSWALRPVGRGIRAGFSWRPSRHEEIDVAGALTVPDEGIDILVPVDSNSN